MYTVPLNLCGGIWVLVYYSATKNAIIITYARMRIILKKNIVF